MNKTAPVSTTEADTTDHQPATTTELTAGQILRTAREAQNIDRGLLAAALKVHVTQLEALEADQYDQLPDSAFTRNFAKTVCQRLKIDEKPVLERLPGLNSQAIVNAAMKVSQVSKETTLRNQTFKSKPLTSQKKSHRIWWIMLALLLIALGVLFLSPTKWFGTGNTIPSATEEGTLTPIAPSTQIERGVVSVQITPPSTTTLPSGHSLQMESSTADPAILEIQQEATDENIESAENAVHEASNVIESPTPVMTQRFVMTTKTESWASIQSASGRVLYQKTLKSGEELSLPLEDLPWKVRIGNASYATVIVRGETMQLRTSSGNVADFEVK